MTIYIGADHNGFAYKTQLIAMLQHAGYTVIDEGNAVLDPADDFPQYAANVVAALKVDPDATSRGILVCGSGQGVCMAANRFKGMRASLCWSIDQARASRSDDDSNILCLSSRYVSYPDTKSVVMEWLKTPFAGADRFSRRIMQMDELS